MPRRYLFIANPHAGPKTTEIGPLIGQVLGSSHHWDLVYTAEPGEATDVAASARQHGYDRVVAAGGDGTVNAVARGLLGAPLPLGILPLGSGNALARSLSIPLRPMAAIGCLPSAASRSIDVGRIGEDAFLSTAGIGIDAEVCHRFNRTGARARGLWPYVFNSVRAILRYEPEEVVLMFPGKQWQEVTPFLLVIANTAQYGYGVTIAPGACPDDGVLDVCVIQDLTVMRALLHGRRLFDGTIDQMPGVTITRTNHLIVRCGTDRRIQVDGESGTGEGEMVVEVLPRALEVLLPAA